MEIFEDKKVQIASISILVLVLLVIFSDQNVTNRNFILVFIAIAVFCLIGFFLLKSKRYAKTRKSVRKKIKQAKKPLNIASAMSIVAIIVCVIVIIIAVDLPSIIGSLNGAKFDPPAEVKNLVSGIRLTTKAKNILYESSLQLKDKIAFNASCGHDGDPEIYIAGCYYKRGDYAYIDIYNAAKGASSLQSAYYNYENSERVTISHELLHAIYEKLGDFEIRQVKQELDKVFRDNAELRDELSHYPSDQKYTELYARAGTEISTLTDALEKHYGQYFEDRQYIVKMYKDCKTQINNMLAEADVVLSAIRQQESIINSARTRWEYNSAIQEYNRLVDTYNQYIGVFRETLNKRDSES